MPPSVSFEFFPPAPGAPERRFGQALDRLALLRPSFVSITYGAGGTTQDRSSHALDLLTDRSNIRLAAHITCAHASRAAVDELAARWARAGITRLVALRGDGPAPGACFQPHPEGYRNAADLVAGLGRVADFDISVACHPEGHPDASSPEADLENLKRKLDAGACRAISQYFFDAEVFLRFRDRAAGAGILAPLVPGIMPVFDLDKVIRFSQACGASIPPWLPARFAPLKNDRPAFGAAAIETASELCQRLSDEGVDRFHFYTLNRAELTLAVCGRLGIRPRIEEAA